MRKLWTLVIAVAVMTPALWAAQGAGAIPAAAPATPQDYDALMKKAGPLYAAMSKNLDGGRIDLVPKDARQLGELFGEAERFWAHNKREDAVKWAQAARKHADEIAAGLAAAKGYLRSDARVQSGVQARLLRARESIANLGTVCTQCHSTYREGDAASGFRIKANTLVR